MELHQIYCYYFLYCFLIRGNLNLESQQDKETYDEKNSSAQISLSLDSVQGSVNKGKINSNYQSVTEQTGIYAGKQGFDIKVGKNTDLKGAVIASEADASKNKLSTDTLTYSDIENKAEYSASSTGVALDTHIYSKDDPNYKNQGLTPVIGTKAQGDGKSTTKSAIANGTLEIKSNPNQDISNLSRDTTNSLNQLEKIFDKKKVEEKQELAQLFGQEVFKAIGDLKLKEGSPEKIALDAVAGGIMSKLGGNSFKTGALSAGLNELVINELKNIGDPAIMQWASAIVGAVAAKLVKGDSQTGASIATSETKNNHLGEGHDSRPYQTGIGVETESFGHVSLIINNEDGSFEEGNFGRYVDVTRLPIINVVDRLQ